jgi:hypothetical protein
VGPTTLIHSNLVGGHVTSAAPVTTHDAPVPLPECAYNVYLTADMPWDETTPDMRFALSGVNTEYAPLGASVTTILFICMSGTSTRLFLCM